MSSSASAAGSGGKNKYAKHAKEDSALAGASATPAASSTSATTPNTTTTLIGRLLIFVGFPFFVGMIGLYSGYISHKANPDTVREMRIDTDFALPFIIALSMVLVIWFQTKGLAKDHMKPKPLISWPKTIKRKKIIHKHVVVEKNSEDTTKDD